MESTSALSPARSSGSPAGSSAPPSGRDVVLPSTAIALPSSREEAEKKFAVLVALLKGLVEETRSGDAVYLAVYRAVDLLDGVVPPGEVESTCLEILKAVRRRPSPLDSLFR